MPDDVFLSFNVTDTSHAISVGRHNFRASDTKTIYALLWLDNYRVRVPPPGLPLPPPAQKRIAKIAAALPDQKTVDGDVTEQRTGHCGNVMRWGKWTCRTSQRFVANVTGFVNPTLHWTINGAVIALDTARSKLVYEGNEFGLNCQLALGGYCLTIESDVGDRFDAVVKLTVTDVVGSPETDECVFNALGSYDGLNIDDLRAETKCIASTIPVPADLGKFTIPKQDEPRPDWNPREWAREATRLLEKDASVGPIERKAIGNFIKVQAETESFRQVAQDIAARFRGR